MAYRYSIPMNLLEIDTLVVGRTLVPENFGTHVVACSSAMIYCCLRCRTHGQYPIDIKARIEPESGVHDVCEDLTTRPRGMGRRYEGCRRWRESQVAT